jgi:hypothetical protein
MRNERLRFYMCICMPDTLVWCRRFKVSLGDLLYNLGVHMYVRYAPTLIWVWSIQYFFGRKWDSISKCRSVVIEYLKQHYSTVSEFRRTERYGTCTLSPARLTPSSSPERHGDALDVDIFQ